MKTDSTEFCVDLNVRFTFNQLYKNNLNGPKAGHKFAEGLTTIVGKYREQEVYGTPPTEKTYTIKIRRVINIIDTYK